MAQDSIRAGTVIDVRTALAEQGLDPYRLSGVSE
jgi:hypothetical protein